MKKSYVIFDKDKNAYFVIDPATKNYMGPLGRRRAHVYCWLLNLIK